MLIPASASRCKARTSEGRSLNEPRSSAAWIARTPRSYCRNPFRASASALARGSVISSGSSARLSRLSASALIAFVRQLLRFAVNHFAGDQFVFESRVAENKTSPLLLPVFSAGLRGLGCFEKGFERFEHRFSPGYGITLHRHAYGGHWGPKKSSPERFSAPRSKHTPGSSRCRRP